MLEENPDGVVRVEQPRKGYHWWNGEVLTARRWASSADAGAGF